MNNIPHKIIGILGGLGPVTSGKFMIDLINQATNETRPAICHWNLPLNISKEKEFIASGSHVDHYRKLLKHGAEFLENAGCTHIVMPCNTVHEFHQELQEAINIPFPNLIKIVGEQIVSKGWGKVLLLATSRTLHTGLYQDSLARLGVKIVTPNSEDQARLDLLIQGLLNDDRGAKGSEFLKALIVKSETDNVLLGCTDLQLLFQPSAKVIDSMQCLIDHTTTILLTSQFSN